MGIKQRIAIGAATLSAAGLLAITGYEGYSDRGYIPIEGDVPTAGWGHTCDGVEVGQKVTPDQALTWLKGDTSEAEAAVKRCVKVPLSQGEMDAYTSLAFNIGSGAFCSSTLVKKLNAGDYIGACEEIRRWVYSGGKKVQGLVNRREAEYRMCIGG